MGISLLSLSHDSLKAAHDDDDDESAHVTHAEKPATPGFAHLRRGLAPIIQHQVSLT